VLFLHQRANLIAVLNLIQGTSRWAEDLAALDL
jgi:hypothetical protein